MKTSCDSCELPLQTIGRCPSSSDCRTTLLLPRIFTPRKTTVTKGFTLGETFCLPQGCDSSSWPNRKLLGCYYLQVILMKFFFSKWVSPCLNVFNVFFPKWRSKINLTESSTWHSRFEKLGRPHNSHSKKKKNREKGLETKKKTCLLTFHQCGFLLSRCTKLMAKGTHTFIGRVKRG